MLWLLLFMVLALAAAGLVVLYVAYPHRGEEVPGVPMVGTVMRNAADAIPTLDDDEVRQHLAQR